MKNRKKKKSHSNKHLKNLSQTIIDVCPLFTNKKNPLKNYTTRVKNTSNTNCTKNVQRMFK